MALTEYHAHAADWREQLRRNERKTRIVITIFLAVYVSVGFLADTAILLYVYPKLSLEECIIALISLQVWPYATLIMLGIGLLSLFITYSLYDRIMLLGTNFHEITPNTVTNLKEKQLYNVVEEMKVAAGLQFMPRVYLIEANYMNAFATGYSEKSAMLAITRGLMEKLDRAEMQAVMSHELSHIRHHDIKLTLTIAVLSNILLIVIDMLFYSMVYRRDKRGDENRLFIVVLLLRYLLPAITLVLTLFLSRSREYMADAGAVELMRNNEPMARALLKINDDHQQHAEQYVTEYGKTPHEQVRQASYLFDPSNIDPIKSLANAFSTHPTLDQRLRALGFKRKTKVP
jgi:heat shock protein HtpX